MTVGLLGVIGELAGFARVFSWFVGPIFPVAIGLLLVGVGLLLLLRISAGRESLRHRWDVDRIGYLAGGITIVVALLGLVGGFAVLYPEAQDALQSQLALSLDGRAAVLAGEIKGAWAKSNAFVQQASCLEAMRALDENPQDTRARAQLASLARGFLSTADGAVTFRTRAGIEVGHSGRGAAEPELVVPLRLPTASSLVWKDGYVLHTRVDMVEGGTDLGTAEIEWRLNSEVLDELAAGSRFGHTVAFAVCAAAGPNSMDCFPFSSTGGKVLRNLSDRFDGQPIPMSYALAGKSGVIRTRDYRGVESIAAFQPVGDLGIGAVLRVDAAHLYGPIGRRWAPLLYSVPLLAFGAILLLRVQMLPVVRRMSESEARFRRTFEYAPIGMLIGSPVEGRIFDVNEPLCEFLGYSKEELTRSTVRDITYPDDLPLSLDHLKRMVLGESTHYTIEKRFLRKDGRPVWAQVSASLVADAGAAAGAPKPLLIVQIESIDERKRMQAALQESEERFRTIADYTYDWEYWVGPYRELIYMSPSCERITGYTQAEFMADPNLIYRLVHPGDQPAFKSHLKHYRDDTDHSIDFRIVTKGGELRWITHSCNPVFSEKGEFRGRRVSNHEITDRKTAEADLASAKERLELALDASSLSIWEYDIAKGVVALDAHWVDIMGGPPGETLTNAEELMRRTHPDDAMRVSNAVESTLKGITPLFQEEFRFQTTAGEWKWILCNGKVTERDADGRATRAVGTNRDITEHKVVEERIHRWAYFDRLTKLPNRRLLEDRMQQFIVQARRKSTRVALLFIDLDRFKPINDEYGHSVGDWLLRMAAMRMQECVRQSDTVARIGGDEFVALLPEVRAIGDAVGVAEKIRLAMAEPFVTSGGRRLSISSSIGIALYPDHARNPPDLLRHGDEAMYRAKRAGRNAVEVFVPNAPAEG